MDIRRMGLIEAFVLYNPKKSALKVFKAHNICASVFTAREFWRWRSGDGRHWPGKANFVYHIFMSRVRLGCCMCI